MNDTLPAGACDKDYDWEDDDERMYDDRDAERALREEDDADEKRQGL